MDFNRITQVLAATGFAERANAAKEAFGARGTPIPSQEWLAQRASSFLEGEQISQTVVSRWLAGTHVPESPIRVWAFAQALVVDPGWLMFGSESGAPAPTELHAPAPTVRRGGREVPEPPQRKRKRAG